MKSRRKFAVRNSCEQRTKRQSNESKRELQTASSAKRRLLFRCRAPKANLALFARKPPRFECSSAQAGQQKSSLESGICLREGSRAVQLACARRRKSRDSCRCAFLAALAAIKARIVKKSETQLKINCTKALFARALFLVSLLASSLFGCNELHGKLLCAKQTAKVEKLFFAANFLQAKVQKSIKSIKVSNFASKARSTKQQTLAAVATLFAARARKVSLLTCARIAEIYVVAQLQFAVCSFQFEFKEALFALRFANKANNLCVV